MAAPLRGAGLVWFGLLITLVGPVVKATDEVDPAPIEFATQVQPILADRCFACHGPDPEGRQAGLRLDTRDGAFGTTELGSVPIVPGDLEASDLVWRIRSEDDDLIMPPPETGKPLSTDEIATLTRWIAQGAAWEEHWAFDPPSKSDPPSVSDPRWIRSPIDAFVLDRLDSEGLTPQVEADRATLIRRLSLDLTGLPPSMAQVTAFVNDPRPDAYERLVDRILDDPAFGERWAGTWLDLARYADTKGYEKDLARTIWRYRDWVIDAFNADLPFDRFTREQLAGDLLDEPTPDQLLATAFHRNTMTNDEGGTDNEEFRVIAVKDRVDTTVQVWMGLTMGCAKCHSHKYDPISQEDYYRLFAVFNQTVDADHFDDRPRLTTPTRDQQRRLAELDRQLTVLRNQIEENDTSCENTDDLEEADTTDVEDSNPLAAQINDLETKRNKLILEFTKTPVLRELSASDRRESYIHNRGNFLDPGKPVEPGLPERFAFGTESSAEQGDDSTSLDRLDVADWLVNQGNPLTARVAVNRVWARLFGAGLVTTEEDFGSQGERPSHPELLDWLAVTYRDDLDWSLKRLCRLIVTSSTYRQSSAVRPETLQRDPDNRLLSRGSRFRLQAEVVRDQALAVAGLLSRRIGGPSVMPPQPDGVWRTTYSKLKWTTSNGGDRARRALYTFWRRTSPYPSMITFDAGSREVCQIRRVRTNTPLQALVTLNDPVYVEAAAALGQRILDEAPAETDARIRLGIRLVLAREARPVEVRRLTDYLNLVRDAFVDDPEAARALLRDANVPVDPLEDAKVAECAAWTMVGTVLINLDETLTRS